MPILVTLVCDWCGTESATKISPEGHHGWSVTDEILCPKCSDAKLKAIYDAKKVSMQLVAVAAALRGGIAEK